MPEAGIATDPGLLLAQLFSPGFPTGAFAWSHGIETAIAEGHIADAASLAHWLGDLFAHGSGRNDAILLAAAHRAAPGDLAGLDALALALCPSAERRAETAETGAAFARTAAAVWGLELPGLAAPVAAGRAARLLGLAPEAAVRHYLFALAASLVSAAVRLVPLGQTEGQKVLAGLQPLCTALAGAGADPDQLGGAAFASDISAMRHEAGEIRLFRS